MVDLSVQVVAGEGPDLAGRDWLSKLNISCGQVHLVQHSVVTDLLDKHSMHGL